MSSSYFDNKTYFLSPKVEQYGSNMVMTNVHKQTKRKYVNLDSRFADHESIDHEYTISLPEKVTDVKAIKVHSVQVPMSFFNISESLGNNFMYVNNTLISIPGGFYTNIASLLDAITASLDVNHLSGLTFTEMNNQICMENTSDQSITIQSHHCTDETKASLGWILGFRKPSYIITPSNQILSESIYNLATIRYIYIVMDEYSNDMQNSFLSTIQKSILNKKLLARIELDTNFYPFGTILRGNEFSYLCSERRLYRGKTDIMKLKLQLVNEWGRPIDLNGLDWSCLLEVDQE